MHLTRLGTRHFRNLENRDLELPSEGVAIVGENAQGKSNFLEAIYYLEAFRSFRGARNDQILRFGEDVFRVRATVETADGASVHEVTAAYQRTGRRRKVTVDGEEPNRLVDALGTLSAVIFSPSDVGIVSDGPAERRRFLDVVLSLNRPGYVTALQRFRHVLAQRNAALKARESADVVALWNEPLAKFGAAVIEGRRRWVEEWRDGFRDYYAAVSGGRPATLRYRSNIDVAGCAGPQEIEAAFGDALQEGADTEGRTRTTMVGPQRDDMVIALDGEDRGLDVREFGSGGQRRTAALALRLVESDTVRDSRGSAPIVLLDDAFAELDDARSERILELIARDTTGQVILTAPKDSDIRLRRDSLDVWRISDGRIRA